MRCTTCSSAGGSWWRDPGWPGPWLAVFPGWPDWSWRRWEPRGREEQEDQEDQETAGLVELAQGWAGARTSDRSPPWPGRTWAAPQRRCRPPAAWSAGWGRPRPAAAPGWASGGRPAGGRGRPGWRTEDQPGQSGRGTPRPWCSGSWSTGDFVRSKGCVWTETGAGGKHLCSGSRPSGPSSPPCNQWRLQWKTKSINL